MTKRAGEEIVVCDFEALDEPWKSIDDGVMGGVSRSRMALDGGVARFEGRVSLEHGGGFASLRSPLGRHDLGDWDGLLVRVRGDGKVYSLRLRTEASFDGISYQARIVPEEGRWSERRLPFDAFRPVFRGREVTRLPALDPGAIRTFGWMIGDRQAGSFRLEIAWIRAYRDGPARCPSGGHGL